MARSNRSAAFITIIALIVNLVGFNLFVPVSFAQGEEASLNNSESISEGGGASNNQSAQNSAGNSQVATGDVNVNVEAGNAVNTNSTNSEENISLAPSSSPTSSPAPDFSPSASPSPSLEAADDAIGPSPIPSSTPTPDISPSPYPTPSPTPETSTSVEATAAEGAATSEPTLDPIPSPMPGTIEVVNDNQGEIGNNVAAEGSSGDNLIASADGNASVDTGDVNVVVGLVNAENTNITNSSLSQFLFNLFENSGEDIDLSELSGQIGTAISADCPPGSACPGSLSVANNNQGTIDNALTINGISGNNQATSENGNVTITTGDVNVVANIFNLLNTNITGSNWYNLIINVFGDWTGDLVLPGKEKMQMFTGSLDALGGSGASVSNSDGGIIENNVQITSDTGGNEAITDATIIRTGDASANANILNMANTNITGGNWFFIAVNNLGKWEGQIFSLPPGIQAAGDSNGVKIFNVPLSSIAGGNAPGSGNGAQSGNSSGLTVANNNSGSIKNNLVINLLTGGNSAVGGGNATIQTGNANAIANIINILNSNITGSNLLTGMVNIFGAWKGNVAFGRPDLWIGASASSPSTLPRPGDPITYTLTYANRGDADATNVKIKSDFNDLYFSVTDPGTGAVSNPGEIKWNIGDVPVGGVGSVSYSVKVTPEIPVGLTALTSDAGITSLERDWNSEDNKDEISMNVFKDASRWIPPDPNLQLTKTRIGEGPIYSGSSVDYEIILNNDSDGSSRFTTISDILYDKWGQKVSVSNWDLGEVFPHEKVTIKYTLNIGSEIPVGAYTGTTQAEGYNYYWTLQKSNQISSVVEVKEKAVEEQSSGFVPDPSPSSFAETAEDKEAADGAAEALPIPEEVVKEIKEAAAEVKKAAAPAKEKIAPIEPKEETIASSIKEILGSEALAKEDIGSLVKTDTRDDKSAGALANKYKNFLIALVLIALVFIRLRSLPKGASPIPQ